MRKLLTCLMILCFVAPCFADDTVYCPKEAKERAKQCTLAKDRNKLIDETILNWGPMLKDGNMLMYRINRWRGESPQQYAARMKSMKSFYYEGLNYPVRGKFTTKGVTFIPLTSQESESVLKRAFPDPRQVSEQMQFVQSSTGKLKPMIQSKITLLEKERRQHTLFLAQCCGYRWTNEGPPQSTGKPYRNGKPKPNVNTGNEKGLLGQEADEQKHKY